MHFSETVACVQSNYQKLASRQGIVAAIVSSGKSQILTFGTSTQDQLFEIGSITKTFTGTLLAQAILEGKLKFSDPIPVEYQKPGTVITFHQLATHTSGIPGGIFPQFQIHDPSRPYQGLSIPIFKRLYAETDLVSEPGSQWAYSNIGTSLLGLILSEKYEKTYAELVNEKIFKVLGMKQSFFQVPSELSKRFPEGYLLDSDGLISQTAHWDLFDTAINPAGGIRSTIADMILFTRAQLSPNSTQLDEAILYSQVPRHQIVDGTSIGTQWIINSKNDLIWHNGQTYGFNAILAISRKKEIAIVAMTNTTVKVAGPQEWDTALQDVVFNCLTR
jgi:D-alanyl-D-alanine-carboxypeptidase/D-alanyl-D-alanine-endopeptidase